MPPEPWATLSLSGDCPTVFIPRRPEEARERGILIRWRWLDHGGFDPHVNALIDGAEISEAFLDSIDAISSAGFSPPMGIRMFDSDREELRRRGARIRGGSLGLAFLLGALCRATGTNWPPRTLAWGAIAPVRDGTLGVFPVEDVYAKTAMALRLGANAIIHVEDQHPPDWEGAVVPVRRSVAATLLVLGHLLQLEPRCTST